METAMSVLLRHPATVPALFSRAVEPDPLPRRRSAWRWFAGAALPSPVAAWAAVALIEVPLVKGGLAVLGLAVT